MARTGKIARLPLAVRDELNMRLMDNESGQTLLAWLNALPVCQERINGSWKGEPINDANLSMWRSGGFADWMEEQAQIREVACLSEYSLKLAEAAGGKLSKGILASQVGKIQKALEQFWSGLRDIQSTEEGNTKDQAVTKLLGAISTIRGLELEEEKLEVKKIEVAQKGESIALEKAKFQRTTAELFIEWCQDEKAKSIALGDATKDNKVAQLIQLWFGEMPENIGPAEFRKPKGAATPTP